MSPWGALLVMVPQVAEKARRMGCHRLRWVVDGEVVYWALLVEQERLEDWLGDTLRRFEAGWPGARTVEILAVWPDRVERVVRAFPRAEERRADKAQG
jgi:hypothetical protein